MLIPSSGKAPKMPVETANTFGVITTSGYNLGKKSAKW
jgi:hypothetical protein